MRTLLRATLGLAALVACAPHAEPVRREVVYVHRAPPAARVEVIDGRPGRDYAWVTGYWRWDRDGYFWTPGHWERSPRGRADWIQGHWRHADRGWYWTPGHWR